MSEILSSLIQTDLKRLLEEHLPFEEYLNLGFSAAYYPKLFQKSLPKQVSRQALLRHFFDRAHLSLYRKIAIPKKSSIVVFSWVMTHGFGDLIAQYEIGKLLKERFPHFSCSLVSLIHKKASLPLSCPVDQCIRVEFETNEDMQISYFPPTVFSLLRSSCLMIQTPTFYPHTPQLKKHLLRMKENFQPFPKEEVIGEYGFIQSRWCHPNLPCRGMGFHFLEKGILIQKFVSPLFVVGKQLGHIFKLLFLKEEINEHELKKYKENSYLLFSYLVSDQGHYVYLHATVKALEKERKKIDILTTDIGGFLRVFQKYQIFFHQVFQRFKIKEVQFYFEGKVSSLSFSSEGKRIRIIHTGRLSLEDCQRLLQISDFVVGCRGDQSFSGAVSFNRSFFYDGLSHAEYFLRDLLDLAHGQFSSYPSVANSIALSLSLLEENPPLYEKGEELGDIWQKPEFFLGMQKLLHFITENYCANETIGDVAARAILHYHFPEVEKKENELLTSFYEGKSKFSEVAFLLKELLLPHTEIYASLV